MSSCKKMSLKNSFLRLLVPLLLLSTLPFALTQESKERHHNHFKLREEEKNCLEAIDDLKEEMEETDQESDLYRIKRAFSQCLELREEFKDRPFELTNFLKDNLQKEGILGEIEFVEICVASLEQLILSLNRHQFERKPDYYFQHVLEELKMTCYEEKFESFGDDEPVPEFEEMFGGW